LFHLRNNIKRRVFQIILHQPQIPPNTGNVIRLCANSGAQLHLVEPLGFRIDQATVRRAGLDYSWMTRVHRHADFDACLAALGGARVFAIETSGASTYDQAAYQAGDALLFGCEQRGLPASVLARIAPERVLSIPMRAGNRSLNLANSVAVVLYEAWRQNGFAAVR
jgi:tRNA (cytidine/uridine-2'-O-)-methyltransferase